MRDPAGVIESGRCDRLRRLLLGPTWHRRLIIASLIVGVQAGVLCVTYRAVVIHGRTMLTGQLVQGTEGAAPPYGYPGPAPQGYNEVDAGASAWQFVPQIRKAHDELASGEIPLWSANVMLGAPLAANPSDGLLNPLTWPLVASPTPAVWDVWLLTRLLMAGLCCTALAWYLGLRFVPATLAGLAYLLSGVFQLRTTTVQTGVMAVLPLLILGAESCIRRPSWRSSGLLAVAVAATILFGMPEEDFLCLAMCAVYFVVRFACEWIHGRQPPKLPVAYAALGGGLVGVLGGLPQILPFLEYVGQGWTIHGAGSRQALVIEDARQLLRLVAPHWAGPGPHYEFIAGYAPFDNWFGVGTIFLAILGVFTRAFPRGVRALMVATAVVVEAKAIGFPDWLNQLVGNAPIISQVSLWAYSGVLVSLAVALLAGAGLQRIQVGALKAWHAIAVAIVLGAGVAAAAPAFVAGTSVVWDQVALTAAILIAVTAGAVAAAARTSQRIRRLGTALAAGAVTVELILLATPGIPLPIRYDPLSPTPTATYLERVMPSGSGRSYSATEILYPTTNQAFNLDDIRNLDDIYVERTYHYMKLFVDPELTDRFDGQSPNAANFIDNPFFNLLNVKYVLVAPPLSAATALPVNLFTLEQVAADGVGIYLNRDAAPRAQVFFNVTSATSEQNAAAIMLRAGFDPTKAAVVETGKSLPVSNSPPIPARIDSYTDSRVVMTTTTSARGTLLLADAYYPGWEAYVDGAPATIYPADIALRGVLVPAGTHTVTMEYRPQSAVIGALGVPAGVLLFGLGAFVVPAANRAVRSSASLRARRT
jgi:Bacterial membrane protein YfhO